MSVSDAARSGDRLKTLIAIRDKLANEIDFAGGRDVAPLVARLQAVLAEIQAMSAAPEESNVVQLADAVARKRAAASSQHSA